MKVVRRKNFEVGKIYKPYKDQYRRNPQHWHNSYFIPLKSLGKSNFLVVVVNEISGPDVGESKNWSSFVGKSLFQTKDDYKHETVIKWIFS
jgi:hypothetical protein